MCSSDLALSEPASIAFMERGDGRSFEEMLANACLFSATPDLLEALEALVAEQNGPPLLGRHEASWREAMAKAEAAIAKAKGEA